MYKKENSFKPLSHLMKLKPFTGQKLLFQKWAVVAEAWTNEVMRTERQF